MNCYICNSSDASVIHKGTRDNQGIDVMRCKSCTLVYLSSQDHIVPTLYESDGQHLTTQSIAINPYNHDTEQRINSHAPMLAQKVVLDFGCGRGAFAKMLKDRGITDEIHTLEPNLKYKTFLSEHFKHKASINEIEDNSIDVITMFHVMEHLPDPLKILSDLYPKLKAGGKIIIEVPHSEDALISLYSNKYFEDFTYWSLHLYLFNRTTLEKLASKTPYKLNYIKYHQRYPLSNHLHWLAESKPGGQNKWAFLNDDALNKSYANKLAELGITDTILMALEK